MSAPQDRVLGHKQEGPGHYFLDSTLLGLRARLTPLLCLRLTHTGSVPLSLVLYKSNEYIPGVRGGCIATTGEPLKTEGEPRGPHSHSSVLETSSEANTPTVDTWRREGGGKVGGRKGREGVTGFITFELCLKKKFTT